MNCPQARKQNAPLCGRFVCVVYSTKLRKSIYLAMRACDNQGHNEYLIFHYFQPVTPFRDRNCVVSNDNHDQDVLPFRVRAMIIGYNTLWWMAFMHDRRWNNSVSYMTMTMTMTHPELRRQLRTDVRALICIAESERRGRDRETDRERECETCKFIMSIGHCYEPIMSDGLTDFQKIYVINHSMFDDQWLLCTLVIRHPHTTE